VIATTAIHDARVHDARIVTNEKGSLHEVWNADQPLGIACRQVHLTYTRAGIVRAWFRHRRQMDSLLVVRGAAVVALLDDRRDSPTCGQLVTLELDERGPQRVIFGPMLWHGFQALDAGELVMAHVNDRPFVHADPDEEKVPIDDPRFPRCWR
jgi:dTDP-4-dehydrorhamnose 3,5-epimerase